MCKEQVHLDVGFIEGTSIRQMAKAKKKSRRYLSDRRGVSSHLVIRGFRPNSLSPSIHNDSLSVPIGQSQLQKAFFRTRLTAAIARKMKNPEG
jgi:hypothetical protein